MSGNNNSTALCPHCAGNHRDEAGDCARNPLVTLADVSFSRDGRDILKNVNLTVREGDFIAITGPNGGGKTTLLRILLNLVKPSTGKVVRNENDIRIGYLPQKNLIDSYFPISVREVILSGLLAVPGISDEERTKRYDSVIDSMGLADQQHKSIGVLSGGQLQRALLGRAIIADPNLLVLDEPLSYIDKRFEARLYQLIEDFAKRMTIVLVSHEMSRIAGMANRHFIVDRSLHACSAHHHYVYSDCE